jgi:hypothetical protein
MSGFTPSSQKDEKAIPKIIPVVIKKNKNFFISSPYNLLLS